MLNISLRQIKAFRAVLARGKIATAADELGLTAPAVTLQIKQLEAELGLQLFDRTPHGVRPTAAGSLVADHVEALMAQMDRLESDLDAVKGIRAGRVRLGLVSTAKYFAPTIIAAFTRAHPGIEVTIEVGNRAEMREALAEQSIELALMGRPPRDLPLTSALLGPHPLIIAAAPGHELAGVKNITKERIAEEHFLIREQGSGTRAALAMFLSDIAGRTDDLGTEMGSNETIKQAVMAGLGIAFISAHTIASEVESGRLVLLDVIGLPVLRHWFVLSRSDRTLSSAATVLQDYIIGEGPKLLPVVPGLRV